MNDGWSVQMKGARKTAKKKRRPPEAKKKKKGHDRKKIP